MKIENKIKKFRNLAQFKDKTEEEILRIIKSNDEAQITKEIRKQLKDYTLLREKILDTITEHLDAIPNLLSLDRKIIFLKQSLLKKERLRNG